MCTAPDSQKTKWDSKGSNCFKLVQLHFRTNVQMSELGSGSFPVEPWDECSLCRVPESKDTATSCLDFWPTETGIINAVA